MMSEIRYRKKCVIPFIVSDEIGYLRPFYSTLHRPRGMSRVVEKDSSDPVNRNGLGKKSEELLLFARSLFRVK